jgi:hypothetical protein
MKKIVFFFFLLIATASTFAQSGRIRVSFAGFDCYRETWDDILHMDGKCDEVFFNFGFTLADRVGNTKLAYEKRTGVYGDASGQFSNRINVGSCGPSASPSKGGIKAGDTYRCNDVIGEYDMTDGDILTVVPTAWEYDPIADNSASFFSTIRGAYTGINQRIAPLMTSLRIIMGDLAGLIYDASTLGVASTKAGGDQGELGKSGTRPIGMQKYGDFSPKLVALNTPNLATISNSDMGFGKGVISVNYNEEALGNSRDHGNYSILLKVEFTPVQSAPPPPPANTNNTTPPINNPMSGGIKKLNLPAAITVAGTWVGTYGNGNNNSPSYYSFKLNDDGTMQVLGNNGAVIANGKYSFANNQLSGSYTYTGSGTYSFAATMSANGSLTGTWGSNNNTSGGGKWVMNKNNRATGNYR